ncbi:C1_3 domain-containing protein/Thioredoxin_8 domain-containing protein [Cephalotus follicularis]|uniref:protein-disulfide reductase n=1 Tax=Cephalotus follicularis TaxID=3775 RepID=A0A1Q3AZ72_CEPFO|nr:C1_3 domain-containing protein/Thioredoxin_8 domain-containing protein [Cephalotus follicularis]
MANSDINSDSHELLSLLSSGERDFLIRNNGDQVKIIDLSGKIVGLYFSGSWCGPCRMFTPSLVKVHEELSSNGDFEVVFISSDRDDESFIDYFSKMPWLAIPFSDLETRKSLRELFKVRGIPFLVILDGTGKVVSNKAVKLIKDYGRDAYPFTEEKISFLKDQEEEAKRNQSLRSILVSSSRDYVVSINGTKVPVSELEGKMVGLYFAAHSHKLCHQYTPKLVEAYKKIKVKGENFEIVLIPLENEEESFQQGFESMPWLALPYSDKSIEMLIRYFELGTLPTLVIIGADGKTLHPNVAELIEEHGFEAYPFTPDRLVELAEIEKARLEAQTLESILVLGDRDFVNDNSGSKVLVSELVGKNILLYFSAHWCPPCRAFLPKLIEAYLEIKAKDNAFEVIFISSDRDQSSFYEFFASMPWLSLPFGDERKTFLTRKFKIKSIPTAIAIGPSGRTLSKEARQLIMSHGADAYPFTEEHLKHLEQKLEEEAKGWPDKVKHELHVEHELILTQRRNAFICNGCRVMGHGWSFYCKHCDFDLHPKCALKEYTGKEKQGLVCDGDVCRKA